MTADSAQREPTMEEILASIRRIISEDDKPIEAGGDVLELKPADPEPAPKPQPAPPPAAKTAPPPAPRPAAAAPPPAPEPVIEPELESEPEFEPEIEAEADEDEIIIVEKEDDEIPQPKPTPRPTPAARVFPEEGLVAEPAATQAAGALGKLMGNMMVQSGVTLDDVVKQMLKPLLKDWLDANLPQLVEIEVQKEIERIRRMAR